MRLLVLNSGSSSIKYQLFHMGDESVLAAGEVERIGEAAGHAHHRIRPRGGEAVEHERSQTFADHREGLKHIFEVLRAAGIIGGPSELMGIGHRVVHGGETFRAPVLIDARVVHAIRQTIPLAPLHNPANLLGIEVAGEQCASVPQVAVFDTAFHHTLPPYAYHYALPMRHYKEHRVRRYGFHGTSHAFVSRAAAGLLKRPLEALNLITLHLGNGASATAIRRGRSIDTSMGMTPLEGLIMGTRCGDLDPSIPFYLEHSAAMSSSQVEAMLNQDSGLKGVCGVGDIREVQRLAQEGHAQARLAIHMFCYRIKKYIGAYLAVLGRLDAVVFTGGIGEHNAAIRAQACAGLEGLGIRIDPARNDAETPGPREIHHRASRVRLLVIPTNEELEIARRSVECIRRSQA